MKRHPILILFAVVLITAALGGCALLPATRSEQVAAEATPTPIPTAPVALKPVYQVQKGEVVKSTTFMGRIAPVVEEELFFQTDGRLRSVNFKRNDMVKQGDIIAELEIDVLERELKAAELELERAQVTLAEAERNLELDRREAQTRVDMAQIVLKGIDADSRTTKAELAAQQKAVELAQIELERLSGGVSPLLQNDVTRAQYAVEKLNQEIADARIIAPFDGKLLSVSLTPGKAVIAYQPMATLADVTKMEASADLLSDQLESMAEQMPVTLVLSNRPGVTLHGVLRRLPYPYGSGGTGQTIEEKDKSTRVTLKESAAEGEYALGDLVRVTVELERKADVLWLPPQAVRNFNGRRFAVLQDGDVQRRVDVKLGIQAEDRVEIVEGLQAGQTVVGQ